MILTNYHTHCSYCDGRGNPELFAAAALEKGFASLGFSSHAPLPFETDWTMNRKDFPEYLKTIAELKKKYRGKMEILTGLEIDYIPGITRPGIPLFVNPEIDYTIGSVHGFFDELSNSYLTVDGPIKEFEALLLGPFNGDIKALITGYCSLIREMVRDFPPDIIGHLDLFKIHNKDEKYFRETDTWYLKIIEKTLNTIADSGVILEVNTGGITRGKTSTLYPSPWILEKIKALGIPVSLNTDAHTPGQLDGYLAEARIILKGLGYTHHMIHKGGSWQETPL